MPSRAASGRSTSATGARASPMRCATSWCGCATSPARPGSIPGSMFAKRLIEKMPGMSRVYYANSGSEANEKVFKMVRQISHRHHGGQEVEDPVPRARLSRHHHHRAVGLRPAAAGDAVWALHAGLRRGAALPRIPQAVGRRELRRAGGGCHRGGDPARRPRHHRRDLPGAGDGRRRRDRAARGLLGARAGDLRASTTSCSISTRSSAAWAAPAPGSATSTTA